MLISNFVTVLPSVFKDKYVRISSLALLIFCILLSFVFRPLYGFLLFCSYSLGFLASFYMIHNQEFATSYLEKMFSTYMAKPAMKADFKSSCSVCDDLSCRRHNLGASMTPWKQLKISEELNDAVEHFYNRILANFISSWHDHFTNNKEFINELRYCMKYASAALVNRILEIDCAGVIIQKLIPQAIKHIDDYLYMQQIAKLKNVKFNDVIVEYLGNSLHPATTNRKTELAYLQHLNNVLIKNLLPQYYVTCKLYSGLIRELISGWVFLPLMDVLSDPHIINSLVIIAVNYKSTNSPQCYSPEVEFLHKFIELDTSRKCPFAMSLNKIKNNTEILYALMQFLKKQEQVHLLQFCLDVDDFNTKLLTPDLSKQQLEDLHVQALNIYKEYLKEESFNFIGCSRTICLEFSELIGDIYSVAKLRTSKPLYQAYDFAFNSLETMWLPQFYHSNEFYNCICGSKMTETYIKASIKLPLITFGSPSKLRSKKYYEQSNYGAVAKISSGIGKIRGVLKPATPIEGSLDPLDSDSAEDGMINENPFRDLSSWKITITKYQVAATKIVYFGLNVLYVDHSSSQHKINNWTTWRKDQDFFTLKAKLVEFHGENEICDSPLPSRKAGASIESRMTKYEDFLTRLLQKPSLKGSDLLHLFLTSEEDFTLVISTMAVNNQDIGNIYQSVAYKLKKEKGQHLDSFINAFINSVIKQKSEKIDVAEEGVELDSISTANLILQPKTFKNDVFKDNFGISSKLNYGDSLENSFMAPLFSENLFYLFRHVFKINAVALRIYVAICSIMQQLIDLLAKVLIERKLKAGLTQHNLAYLIGLLEGVIFSSHTSRTEDECKERKLKAFEGIQFCPNYLNKILGGQVNEGLKTILDILQNPHYNKQLAYNLLDSILVELFPELSITK